MPDSWSSIFIPNKPEDRMQTDIKQLSRKRLEGKIQTIKACLLLNSTCLPPVAEGWWASLKNCCLKVWNDTKRERERRLIICKLPGATREKEKWGGKSKANEMHFAKKNPPGGQFNRHSGLWAHFWRHFCVIFWAGSMDIRAVHTHDHFKNFLGAIFVLLFARFLQDCPSGQIAGLGRLQFCLFHHLPNSAWADGELAELAEQVEKMVEYHRSKSTQPNYPTRWTSL